MERVQLNNSSSYFPAEPTHICFHSGCALLDCVLGGGYAEGRVVNIVGDKSTGKTLLAIEAAANYARAHPDHHIWYNEVESAFDLAYAERLGLPADKVEFVEGCDTVEDMFEHIEKLDVPGLYIVDSLDALSDREEMKRGIADGTFGAGKAKKMSEVFRRLTRRLGKVGITVIIISQVRDNIGVTFGEKTSRSGGRALDFYASQVLFLSQIEVMKKTVEKIERPIGIVVRAKCKKNKVGPPFREAEFPIIFYYGIDDLRANIVFLEDAGKLSELGLGEKGYLVLRKVKTREEEERVACFARKVWQNIEAKFLPTRSKYGEDKPESGRERLREDGV